MKKEIFSITLAATLAFTSCSKDDDDTIKCESCTANETKVEICENSDGTYTLTIDGEQSSVLESLEGLTPKQMVDSSCGALSLLSNL